MSAGVYSRLSGVGPWVYLEHGRSSLHLYFRYFWLPWQRGWRWGYWVRLRGRTLLHGGRP